jgi:hypothetical protein
MKRALLLVALLLLPGCGGSRVDPPPRGEDDTSTEVSSDSDSLAAWARRTRDLWAAGDSAAAGALARKAFGGAWAQAEDARASAEDATTTERLPDVRKDVPPSSAQVTDALTRVGLAVDIVESHGTTTVWQVLVSDPVGSATARTEFWAWRDPHGFSAVVQGLPPDAPTRTRYGPDAVGDLASRYRSDGGAELASAWARPRSRGGLEVALATRARGDGEHFKVTSNRVLSIEADTVSFEDSGALVVIGGGGRDPMFDECPTCPHLERVQRYMFKNGQWALGEEKISPTPYAAFVSFMHALREGGDALPYASSPLVIEQATGMGLELGRGPLRAAPGTLATDPTQRYRTGGAGAIEVTLSNATGRWVVDDVRPTQIVIE